MPTTAATQALGQLAPREPMGAGSMLLAVLGILAVVAAAYWATWLIARRARTVQQGRALRLLDRFSVDKGQTLCLVELGEKIYLVALTGGGASLIDTLSGPQAEAVRAASAPQQGELLRRGAGLLALLIERGRQSARLRTARKSLTKPDDPMAQLARRLAGRRRPQDGGEGGDAP